MFLDLHFKLVFDDQDMYGDIYYKVISIYFK